MFRDFEALDVDVIEGLLAKLEAGDGLYAPVTVQNKERLLQVSVLRVDDAGALFLSAPAEDCWMEQLSQWSPYRWDASKATLVDKEGDVPAWYSLRIGFEKGAAAAAAVRYAMVPRLQEDTMCVDDAVLEALHKSPLLDIIRGILGNGEAGALDTQLKLVCDGAGVSLNQTQLSALTIFCEMFAVSRLDAMFKNGVKAVAIALRENDSCDDCSRKGECLERKGCDKPTMH